MSTINLKVGRTYVDTEGNLVTITEMDGTRLHPFFGGNGRSYTKEGLWYFNDTGHPRNLVTDLGVLRPGEVSPGLEKAGEVDPNGISQNTPGAKNDAGKLLPRLVLGEFAHALEEVTRIGTAGARKYTPRGWLSVPDGEDRYREAAGRHQLAVDKGLDWDNGDGGTGRLHKGQVIWNLLAELELELRRGKYGEQA